jgi:predicted Zn-dependent peptidase
VREATQKTTLENGIRVLSEHMDGVRSVSVGVLVDVGPKDEQPAESGYAHLLEHMLFQGTGERDAKAIAEMMEIGGGAIGAFTARDYTVYHATMLDEYLPFALEVLGDMLCNSVLPEEALERQIGVIVNEIAGNDDPISSANDLLKATLWPNHPMGNPTAGLEETLQQASRDDLLEFMRQHYIASKLILAAAGNVDHENFVAQTRDSFWQMNGLHSPSHPPSSPEPHLGAVIAQPRDRQQVYFALAWPAPAYTSPQRYAWHVFSSLYGGGPTSRLYRRLREEQGMVYHIDAQYQAYGTTGALVVEGATLPQTLVPVLAGTLIELWQMGEGEINLDEYHRATQSLISQHLVSGDSAYVRMSRLALQEQYFRQTVPSDEVIAGLSGLRSEEVQQVALEIFSAGLPTIALVGPVSDKLLSDVETMLSDFGEPSSVTFTGENGQSAFPVGAVILSAD